MVGMAGGSAYGVRFYLHLASRPAVGDTMVRKILRQKSQNFAPSQHEFTEFN